MILVVNWFEIQLIWLSSDLRFKWFWLSIDLWFNWFEIQLIWLSPDLRFKWFWLSIDLRFKWFGCQSMCASNDFGCLLIWTSSDVVVNRAYSVNEALKIKNEAFVQDFLQNWSFEAQKRSISARLPSKIKLWSSKTKHLCETSFKHEALKIKSEAFLRDFLQKCSFEAQKRSFSATKLFCETSFKNEALKIKNEAFLRDFLQKWQVDRTLDLRFPIRFNDFEADASKVLRLPRKSWAEAYEVL